MAAVVQQTYIHTLNYTAGPPHATAAATHASPAAATMRAAATWGAGRAWRGAAEVWGEVEDDEEPEAWEQIRCKSGVNQEVNQKENQV
jgi:hypothetical protein